MIILPRDIADRHYFGAFGHCESEVSARWLVEWLKRHSPQAWVRVPVEALDREHQEQCDGQGFRINRLEETGYVKLIDGYWHVTPQFIFRCYEAAPARDVLTTSTDGFPICQDCGAVAHGNLSCRTCVEHMPDSETKTALLGALTPSEVTS